MSRAIALILWGALFGCAGSYRPAVVGLPADDGEAELSAVWVGHATVLLRIGSQRVLTDPNLGGRMFVVPRETPASLTHDDLPMIDAVVISHLHFDHFHRDTLKRLPPNVPVFFPDNSEPYTTNLNHPKLAMDPWQSTKVGNLRITAVPVSHFGGRYGLDSWWNASYTGYVIEGYGKTVFFAGDTGYHPEMFKEIGRRFDDIDLALIPIAPYRGDSGSRVHTDPQEALQIFDDVKARHMLPIHFEAFYGLFGGLHTPRKKLTRLIGEQKLEARVHALYTGERLVVPEAGAAYVIRHLPGQPALAKSPGLVPVAAP